MSAATKLDLSGHTTAEAAARALYAWVRKEAEASGQKPDIETLFAGPDECERLRGTRGWLVSWESGPHEWAIWLTGGASIYAGEAGWMAREIAAEAGISGEDARKMIATGPEVVGFYATDDWIAEPYYSFDLVFRDD